MYKQNQIRNGILIGFFLVFLSLKGYSQLIHGTVKSNTGEILPGVSVLLKGTTKGTSTDDKGKYTIQVQKGNQLLFSFIGYELKEVSINDKTELNVVLVESSEHLDEVVVTSENRSVSAQKVPITMDLVSGGLLKKSGTVDLIQLQSLAPGLNIVQNTVFNQINVRGIGSNDGSAELSDQAVTIGVDGEYINRPIALNASLFDLERVEVLKGPQGTLYGRNATGGAINIIANKPKQNKEADFSATYGNYNTIKFQGAVNMPLGKKAAVRAAGLYSKHDGYRDGGDLVGRIDNGNFWATRLGLSLNPTDKLSAYFAWEYNKTNQQAPSQYGVSLSGNTEFQNKSVKEYSTDLPKDYNVATAGFLKIDQWAARGKINYDLGKAHLTYTGGFRNINMSGYQPLNGFIPEIFSFDNKLDYQTISNELLLHGESEKLSWQIGGFYGKENQNVARGLVLPAAAGAFGGKTPYLNFFISDVTSQTSAVFGQFTYNFNEKFSFTGGLRNTTDKKEKIGDVLASAPFAPNAVVFFYPNAPTSGTQAGMVPLTGVPTSGKWNVTTWLADFDYKFDTSKMIFAKVSTGYKAGGFDNVGAYNAEKLTSYEIGTKNTFNDGKLRLNLSAFHYDYKDQQVSIFFNTQVGAAIQNAGKTTVNGVEFDGAYKASKADNFKFTVNFLDAQYKDLPTIENTLGGDPIVVNLKGNKAVQSPKWTLIAGYNHDFKVGSGLLNTSIETLFKSDYYLTAFNYKMDRQDSYTKTDLNITYTPKGAKWDVGLFVQNLEDKRIINYASFTGGGIDIYNWSFGAPRLIGIKANLHL